MGNNALQAVLNRAAAGQAAPTIADAPEKPSPVPQKRAMVAKAGQGRVVKTSDAGEASQRFHRPVRDGKRFVGGHFTPELVKQLRMLAAEDDTTIQALLEEALDLLFVKKGKAQLAVGNSRP